MRALIDADIFLYRVGYATEQEDEQTAIDTMQKLIERCLDATKATAYTLYLSCPTAENFRTLINPLYKAQRTREKPKHFGVLRDYLVTKWDAQEAVKEEADDLIGINLKFDEIAITIDKDILYGLVGNKYNFVKEEFFYTGHDEALLFFYKQLLMGDRIDNIEGVPKIGPVKADNALSELLGSDEIEIYTKVFSIYQDYYSELTKEEVEKLILKNGQQLKIRTHEGEIWQLPVGQRAD
jgi:5'-3' exonuclease